MPQQNHHCQLILSELAKTVDAAAAFFMETEESLNDGYQSAREVLSHLVFWHREYMIVAKTLVAGEKPRLKKGTYAELNAAATCEFEGQTMEELAHLLVEYQTSLEGTLLCLPDWGVVFPVKYGGRLKNVADRLKDIEAHIRNHVDKLQRADRRGQDWVRAYYPEETRSEQEGELNDD